MSVGERYKQRFAASMNGCCNSRTGLPRRGMNNALRSTTRARGAEKSISSCCGYKRSTPAPTHGCKNMCASASDADSSLRWQKLVRQTLASLCKASPQES
jgi:hypothetical protein